MLAGVRVALINLNAAPEAGVAIHAMTVESIVEVSKIGIKSHTQKSKNFLNVLKIQY